MTFTEAAVEVLRRAGKPLHYKEIAEAALRENLLSHVGQDPEITMGQRLAAMAKREDDRKVVAVTPEGTFALIEWAVPQDFQIQAVAPPMQPAETGEPLYRPREREPRAIHAQARRRLAELQAEHEEGYEEVEAERRRQDLGRKGQRRFPPPAEVVFEALAQRQPAGHGGAPGGDPRAAPPGVGAGYERLREPVRGAAREDGDARRAGGEAQQGGPAVSGAAAARRIRSARGGEAGARRQGDRARGRSGAAQGPGPLFGADGARALSRGSGPRRAQRGQRRRAGPGGAVHGRGVAGGDDRLPRRRHRADG